MLRSPLYVSGRPTVRKRPRGGKSAILLHDEGAFAFHIAVEDAVAGVGTRFFGCGDAAGYDFDDGIKRVAVVCGDGVRFDVLVDDGDLRSGADRFRALVCEVLDQYFRRGPAGDGSEPVPDADGAGSVAAAGAEENPSVTVGAAVVPDPDVLGAPQPDRASTATVAVSPSALNILVFAFMMKPFLRVRPGYLRQAALGRCQALCFASVIQPASAGGAA